MNAPSSQDRFVALLEAHRRILYKVANVYGARAEDRADLVQDIVAELWHAFPRFDGRAAFSTWMYRIAVNVAISFHRGEGRRVRDALPIEDAAMDLAAADRVMDAAGDDMLALRQLIARLDGVDRALVLFHLEGYGHDEIATLVGLSTTNVATRLHRIRQRLQDLATTETPA